MEQRVSMVTLGVHDLPRARGFYERLGWRGQEVERTVFFQAGGLVVVLWGGAELAQDCGVPERQSGGFALAHNVHSRAEVDSLLTAAQAAGATITRQAGETSYGGYAGVFSDPDGHCWEVAHNPGFPVAPDGTVTVPDFGGPG